MNFDDFLQKLSAYKSTEIIFVGLGNESRGDDGAGLYFIKRLQKHPNFKKSKFIVAGVTPENHLDTILEYHGKAIVFIDAVIQNQDKGKISFIQSRDIADSQFSTHSYSISMIEKYLAMTVPYKFYYIGIEPDTMSFNAGLSNIVQTKIDTFFKGAIGL